MPATPRFLATLLLIATSVVVVAQQPARDQEIPTPLVHLTLPGTWKESPQWTVNVGLEKVQAFYDATTGSLMYIGRSDPMPSAKADELVEGFPHVSRGPVGKGVPDTDLQRKLATAFFLLPDDYMEASGLMKVAGGKADRPKRIWEIKSSKGNVQSFYVSQLTPGMTVTVSNGNAVIDSDWARNKVTRAERRTLSAGEALIGELETEQPVTKNLVEWFGLPPAFTNQRVRYTLVGYAATGFDSSTAVVMIVLGTPVNSGLDAGAVLKGLGVTSVTISGPSSIPPSRLRGLPAFEPSLSEKWKPQAGWEDPLKAVEVPEERPFQLQSCKSWLNSQTLAALRVCSDTNWLKGKTEAEVERLFLEEPPQLQGRTFLAENLMHFFFPPPRRFYEEVGKLTARVMAGRLTKDDIAEHLVGNTKDNTRFALLGRLEPHDIYEAYSAALSPGLVISIDGQANRRDIDVDFAPHRAASLGTGDFAGRKWMSFLLVEDNPLPKDSMKLFGPTATGDQVRFLWLVGGGTSAFNDGSDLSHVVVAELWNGHSQVLTLETLEESASPQVSGTPVARQSSLAQRRPRTWIANDESWKAWLGGKVRLEIPDAALTRHDFLALLGALPDSGKDLRKAEDALKALLETPADASDIHYALGWVLNHAGRPDEALPHLQRVLELDPEHPLVLFDIGVSYALKHDFSKAVTSYEAALARYPDFMEAKLNLCAAYTNTEDVDKLKSTCAVALDAAPENPSLLNNLA